MKYVCEVCGWEYDEELGCPEKGIAPAPSGKISPKILSAPCAPSARISSLKNKEQEEVGNHFLFL